MTDYENALQYVRDNKTWSDAQEEVAWERINELRCDIYTADAQIADSICDLFEEYGEENGLPEGWWYEITDEDEIFFDL